MTKFVYTDIYWLSVSLDPHRTRQKPRFPNRPEYSLMTRFNSLLSPKKFPVRARREFPSTVLKLLPYFAPLPSPGGSNPTKFSVFSTEFPDHREYSTGRFFWAQQLIEDTREAGSEKRRSAGE